MKVPLICYYFCKKNTYAHKINLYADAEKYTRGGGKLKDLKENSYQIKYIFFDSPSSPNGSACWKIREQQIYQLWDKISTEETWG